MVGGIPDGAAILNQNLRDDLEWLSCWDSSKPERFVVLRGPRGRGKTTYAAATLRRALGCGVLWVEWTSLMREVANSWDQGGDNLIIKPLLTARFLVVDDFGKELAGHDDARMPGWQKRVAFEVINHRYTHRLPTVLTTELGAAEMGDRLDGAITSRLMHEGRWIDLSEQPDYRLLGGKLCGGD
jgi:DNA replication protein DnaC